MKKATLIRLQTWFDSNTILNVESKIQRSITISYLHVSDRASSGNHGLELIIHPKKIIIVHLNFFQMEGNIFDPLKINVSENCPDPTPTNGRTSIVYHHNGTEENPPPDFIYSAGVIIQIVCDEGYQATGMYGLGHSICEDTGVWSQSVQCIPNDDGKYR